MLHCSPEIAGADGDLGQSCLDLKIARSEIAAGNVRYAGHSVSTLPEGPRKAARYLSARRAAAFSSGRWWLRMACIRRGGATDVAPQVFVPGTPIWIDTQPIWKGDEDWFALVADNAVVIPGPARSLARRPASEVRPITGVTPGDGNDPGERAPTADRLVERLLGTRRVFRADLAVRVR